MQVRLGLGLSGLPFANADGFWRWIELCEQGGVDSLWQSDRLVGGASNLEALSAMAALAGATKRLKFGMNVLALAFREPIVVAKACATIDYLSKGRLLPAFGIGSPQSPDWKALGIPEAGRGKRTDEALEIIIRLCAGESVTFRGEHYAYENASISPLPLQQPLPVWLGGSSPAAIRRTARFGTGWHAGAMSAKQAGPVVAAIKQAAIEAGRPIDDDHFGTTLMFALGDRRRAEEHRAQFRKRFPTRDPEGIVASGVDELLRLVAEHEAVGVTKFILLPLANDEAELFAETEQLIAEVIPKAHRRKPALAV